MKKKLSTEALSILGIQSLKDISSIFLGPFLVAYFIQNTQKGVPTIAIFYMCVYTFTMFIWFWVAKFSNNKHKIFFYRVGIALQCIYMLPFIILKDNVTNYILLIAFIQASMTSFFYAPGNFLVGEKIKEENRKDYELVKEISASIIRIILPIFLGFMITATNYSRTAIIVLILSIIEFFLSFNLNDPKEYKNDNYRPTEWLIEKIKDKDMRNVFLGEFLKGLTINNGALNTIITIFIVNKFNSNETLGYITSFAYAVSIVFAFIYNKYFKNNDDKVIMLCSALPFVLTLSLVLFTNTSSILFYNLIYSALVSTLLICANARLWNKAESKSIKKVDRVEFWFIREMMLCLGRVVSYTLLLLIVLYCNKTILYLYTIILSFSILQIGYTTIKTEK